MKRPAFQFYPADWRKDSALQSTSIAARGLWIEMTCIMHECDPYGHLAVNGNPLQEMQLSRLVGESVGSVKKLLAELEDAGVFSRLENGCIYSRRMVKDEHLRNVRAEAGRLGGNPNLLNQKDKQTDNQDHKQSTTPSSSSSSTTSKTSSKTTPDGDLFDGIDPQIAADFKAMRNKQRAGITKTAIDGIRREASKAGLSFEDALTICCERGWRGFKADWVLQPNRGSPAHTSNRDASRAAAAASIGLGGNHGNESRIIDIQCAVIPD